MTLTNKAKLFFALAFALPLVFGGTAARAFSYSDGLAGGGGSESLTDPYGQFDAMSDQMSRMWDQPSIDYSDQLSGADGGGQGASGSSAAPRQPVNIGRNH
jgi:hypothetical protein